MINIQFIIDSLYNTAAEECAPENKFTQTLSFLAKSLKGGFIHEEVEV
jgi:hypothetical protein